MNFRMLILSLVALTGTVHARTKTDVLVMTNGDHLTCEIKGLDSGVLYVSFDYILSTQSVQWSKVDHIESKQLFLVRTEDGSVYTGTLSTPTRSGEQPVKIEIAAAPERVTVVERKQVVKMEETSQKFWQRFNGSVNFGLTYSKGNQSTQYNLSSDASYPRERWAAQAGLNSTLTSSTGASASDFCVEAIGSMRELENFSRVPNRALISKPLSEAAWDATSRIRIMPLFLSEPAWRGKASTISKSEARICARM
jgi:hypothetical protein